MLIQFRTSAKPTLKSIQLQAYVRTRAGPRWSMPLPSGMGSLVRIWHLFEEWSNGTLELSWCGMG